MQEFQCVPRPRPSQGETLLLFGFAFLRAVRLLDPSEDDRKRIRDTLDYPPEGGRLGPI
jgi:hypothetical protein